MPYASAQENNTSTTSDVNSEEYELAVSDQLRIVDYSFENGIATVTVESDKYQMLVFTEMMTQKGAKKLNQKEVHVSANKRTTIEFDTQGSNGFTLASPDGIVGVKESGGGMFSFAATFTSTEMIIYGILSMLGGVGVVGAFAYKRRLNVVTEIEREY